MPGYEGIGLPSIVPQGTEVVAVDTGLNLPAVAGLSVNQLAPANNFRNLLEGADFTVNPWQRGTSFTAIANTLTYGPDRWFALGGASSSISMSRQTSPSGALPGWRYALRFGRAAANADTTAINLGQVLGTNPAYRVQGKSLTMSILAVAGANFSAVGGAVTVTVYGGTGADEAASNMMAGTWTGQSTLTTQTINLTNTSWAAAQTLTLAPFTVPATVNELGLKISYTPVGPAGAADWIEITMMQLEIGSTPSQFERRNGTIELELCQRFYVQINEPAAGGVVASGMNTGAAAQSFVIPLAIPLRVAPTVTFVTSGASWRSNQAGTPTAATLAAGSVQLPYAVNITSGSAGTAGQGTLLQGNGGTGAILITADF